MVHWTMSRSYEVRWIFSSLEAYDRLQAYVAEHKSYTLLVRLDQQQRSNSMTLLQTIKSDHPDDVFRYAYDQRKVEPLKSVPVCRLQVITECHDYEPIPDPLQSWIHHHEVRCSVPLSSYPAFLDLRQASSPNIQWSVLLCSRDAQFRPTATFHYVVGCDFGYLRDQQQRFEELARAHNQGRGVCDRHHDLVLCDDSPV